MPNIDMGIFKPVKLCSCDNCGRQFIADHFQPVWVEDIQKSWCECCAQFTYMCKRCKKIFTLDTPYDNERGVCSCVKCPSKPDTAKPAVPHEPVRKIEESKPALPQNLSDAFSQKYRVWAMNPKEKIALLTECQTLGLKWLSGQSPLEFNPGQEEFCLEMYDGHLTYGIKRISDKEIRWADLPFEVKPDDKSDAVKVPIEWEIAVRNILRFKLLLNYDVSTDTYHKKVMATKEIDVAKIMRGLEHGAKTLKEVKTILDLFINLHELLEVRKAKSDVFYGIEDHLTALGLWGFEELEEVVEKFIDDHVVCDYDLDGLLNKPFADKKQVGKS